VYLTNENQFIGVRKEFETFDRIDEARAPAEMRKNYFWKRIRGDKRINVVFRIYLRKDAIWSLNSHPVFSESFSGHETLTMTTFLFS
jgi:hypothetical protein